MPRGLGGTDHVFLRRHSRVGGNLDAACAPQPAGHRRVCSYCFSRAALGRLPRGAGAEDDGACGEE